jgi:tripartite motif-containing protein 71
MMIKSKEIDEPNSVAVDSSGNVYVADTNNHRIQKFTSTGQFITEWGSYGTADGQFNRTGGLATDSSVTDSNNNNVQKFNSTGQFITKLTLLESVLNVYM